MDYNKLIYYTKEQKERLIKYYDRDDRKPYKYMSRMPEWVKAYDEMCVSGRLALKINGVDPWILEQGEVFQGSIDWEKYKTGKYTIAINNKDNKDDVFQVGESITVDGETYEIMAVIDLPRSITPNDSQNTVFSYDFFIDRRQFQKIYPNAPLYHSYIEVKEEFLHEVENFLKKYQNEMDSNLNYVSRESYLQSFQKEIDAQTVMGKKQAFLLFLYESLMLMSLTLLVTLIVGSLCSFFGLRPYLSGDEIHTYQFTLIPLIQVTPILLFISIAIPWIHFYSMEKKSLIERLVKDVLIL